MNIDRNGEVMDRQLPGIVVTGASGFVGRHFLEAARGKYRLFCLARRSQYEAGIPKMEQQRWTQVDVAQRDALLNVSECIEANGGADYLLHLAGYYDFTNREHPEYERTNVRGTRNVLDLASKLGIKRVIFASSLAACSFPERGACITEESSADATVPYARSKRDAEEVIREHDAPFARTIVRLAAIFSDWCEYPPVYAFLNTWLSSAWNARMLGGRGKSAVPYLHIRDLVSLFLRIVEKSAALPPFAVYNASPSHTTSHEQLFCTSTRFLYGRECAPVHIPRAMALPAVALRQAVASLFGKSPFEKIWMLRYIDRELRVDATHTYRETGWKPTPRYDLARRMLILIENMKTQPELWTQRNQAAFVRVAQRPNLTIASMLKVDSEIIIPDIVQRIRDEQDSGGCSDYVRMTAQTLTAYVTLFFEVLLFSIRTRDRRPIRTYARLLAFHRQREGFEQDQVSIAIELFGPVLHACIAKKKQPGIRIEHIQEAVDLSLQLALDEVEEAYDRMRERGHVPPTEAVNIFSDVVEMIRLVDELHDVCRDSVDVLSRLTAAHPGVRTPLNKPDM
ncbi:NAD(P)-dependent oxidoreductase [bacterium]|nr:NAD(P)-dependent oxidoreductase [bacterium]